MSRRRSILVYAIIVLTTLLLFVSSLTVWTKRQLLNTDAWTNASAQVLANPAVKADLSNRLVDRLYQRVDVAAQLEKALPPRAKGAAPAVAAGLQTAAVRAVNAFLGTPAAQRIWEVINRRAHTALVNVLEGKPAGPISAQHGDVVLDVSPLLNKIASRIGIHNTAVSGSSQSGRIVLLHSDQLKTAQHSVRVLKVLSIFLLIVVFVLYGLAIYLARGRRRVLLEVVGASVLIAGLLLAVVRRVAGNLIIDSLVKTQSDRPAVKAVWLIETQLMRDIAVALMAYGIVAIIAGWLGGPSRPAVAIRRFLAPTFRERPIVIYGVAFVVFLILIAWGPTNATRQIYGVLVLAGLIALGLEAWRRETLREFPGEAGNPEPVPPAPPETQPQIKGAG